MKRLPINRQHLSLGHWRYRQYSRNAQSPVFSPEQLAREGYVSQCGQDKWAVEELFRGQRNGVFVDIGAHDGVTFSNTLYLERELGWTGLAVEPIPDVFERLQSNRRCSLVRGCVSSEPGKATFQVITGYSEMLSGIAQTYDAQHEARIERELAEYGGTRGRIEVDAYTLTGLLESRSISAVDFMSVDVEGAELAVLSSLDWGRFPVSVIAIENNYKDWKIPRFLSERGYKFHSILGDEFYVHEGFNNQLTKQ